MNFVIVIFGCVCWIPLAIWILCLIHWTVQGDVDWLLALAGICLGLGIGFVAIRPPVPILSPIACCIAFITVFAFPLVQALSNRHQLRSVDLDAVERAYRAIGNAPHNQFAKFALAESVYKLGLTGHAVALGDVALANLPERIAVEEHRTLKKWKRVGVLPHTLQPIVCVECQCACLPGWTHCRDCGAPFLLHRTRGRFLPTGLAQKLVAIWASAVILLIGLPTGATLQVGAAVAVIFFLVALAAAILFFSFRKRSGHPV